MDNILNQGIRLFELHGVPNAEQELRRVAEIVSARGLAYEQNWFDELDFEDIAMERARGVPLEYALGHARFMGHLFRCDRRALVPRQETELLARTAIALARSLDTRHLTIVDIGTGSGNLAVTLAHELPHARVYASDVSSAAAELAEVNVAEHDLQDRVSVHEGSLFEPLAGLELEGRVDLVVSNPPYIPTASLERLAPHIRDHEPIEAFDGGGFGLDIFRGLLAGSRDYLRPDGALCFELGLGQDRLVRRIVDGCSFLGRTKPHLDGDGAVRVLSALRLEAA